MEFYGEVGVGAGPTQEFYSCVCQEVTRKEFKLWWDTDPHAGEHVSARRGLYPAPLPPAGVSAKGDEERKKALETFEVIGWVCGKALHDRRLLDLPLALPLCRALQGGQLEVDDMRFVCPDVHKTFVGLQEIASKKRAIIADKSLKADQRNGMISELTLNGTHLSDLGIYFAVPGYDHVLLKENGADIMLSIDNVEEYVELLPRVVLVDAAMPQLCAMREGMRKVIPIESLRLFCVEELQQMFASDDTHSECRVSDVFLYVCVCVCVYIYIYIYAYFNIFRALFVYIHMSLCARMGRVA